MRKRVPEHIRLTIVALLTQANLHLSDLLAELGEQVGTDSLQDCWLSKEDSVKFTSLSSDSLRRAAAKGQIVVSKLNPSKRNSPIAYLKSSLHGFMMERQNPKTNFPSTRTGNTKQKEQ